MGRLIKKYKINRDKPTIGITGPDKGGEAAWFFTALSVRLAGGRPIRITPAKPRTADGLQGLIIGGGADVDPDIYQQENIIEEYLRLTINQPRINNFQKIKRMISWIFLPFIFLIRKIFSRKIRFGLDRARDHLELQLIDQAVQKKLPLMGICRGSQLLNSYFRGTLHQDIQSFYTEQPNPASIFPVKKIFIKKDSTLEKVLGVRTLRVNALHNQAVNDPGKDIEIVAREKNQVVQAIESNSQPFMIGVQWHPEYLPQSKDHQKLFKALVEHAKEVNHQIEDADLEEALAKPEKEYIFKEY